MIYGLRRLSRRDLLGAAGFAGAAFAVGGRSSPAAAGRPAALGDGERLDGIVRRYSRWRHHRTGTGFGQATTRFFERELRARGAATERWSYAVDLFDWSAHVRVGHTAIETVPVYFEAVGSARTDSPFVEPVTLPNAAGVTPLNDAIAAAASAGASIAVIPTFGFFPAIPGVPNLPHGPYGAPHRRERRTTRPTLGGPHVARVW